LEGLVDNVSDNELKQLAEWRGYSIEFCQWLRDSENIGWTGQHSAFPFFNNGKVVATHIRHDKRKWEFRPVLKELGLSLTSLIIGELTTAKIVVIAESQWDAFAALDALGIYRGEPVAGVSTRGCQ
jgi:hypothetical protein